MGNECHLVSGEEDFIIPLKLSSETGWNGTLGGFDPLRINGAFGEELSWAKILTSFGVDSEERAERK